MPYKTENDSIFPGKRLFPKFTIPILLIISLCLIIYSNTLNSQLVFDDEFVIIENPIVKDLGFMINPSRAKVYKGHFDPRR